MTKKNLEGYNAALQLNYNIRDWKAVRVLLKKGADIDHIRHWLSKNGESRSSTLLTEAAYSNQTDVILNLLGNSANVDKPNDIGVTPLMFASKRGNMESVMILVDNYATLDQCDNYGMTAIMFASSNGHYDVLVYLANKGANLKIIDRFGQTAYDLAKKRDHREIVTFIEDRLRAEFLEKRQLLQETLPPVAQPPVPVPMALPVPVPIHVALPPVPVPMALPVPVPPKPDNVIGHLIIKCDKLAKENSSLSFEVSALRRANTEQAEMLIMMKNYISTMSTIESRDENETDDLLRLCIGQC